MTKPQALIVAAERSRLHKCWVTVVAVFIGEKLERFQTSGRMSCLTNEIEICGEIWHPVAWFYDGFELDSSAAWLGATEAAKADTPVNMQA